MEAKAPVFLFEKQSRGSRRETHFPFSFFTGSLHQSNGMQGEAGASFSSAFKLLASEYAQTALTSTGAPLLAPGSQSWNLTPATRKTHSQGRLNRQTWTGTFSPSNSNNLCSNKATMCGIYNVSTGDATVQFPHGSVCITVFGPQSRDGLDLFKDSAQIIRSS